MDAAPTRWIRTDDQLADLVGDLAGCGAIGIDTEADSLHHYTEKVCLIQLTAFGGASWLVDPLALRDLSPLAPVLADASVLKVVHGGDNDVTSLRRDFGFTFRTMFDTAIAARLLGDTEVGLAGAGAQRAGRGAQQGQPARRLVEAAADREARGLRPRRRRAPDGARGPVHRAARRRRAYRVGPRGVRRPREPATGGEADRARRVPADQGLREAVATPAGGAPRAVRWREARAAAADRPPFKIVGPEILLALAERSPTTVDEVARALASYPRQAGQIEVVVAAIQRGLDLPEAELPAREHGERPVFPAAARRRVEALRAWRDAQARHARLDPSIVLPLRLIERVALAGPQTLDELAAIDGVRQWRVAEWGPALLAAGA